jgi:hypothetical protein
MKVSGVFAGLMTLAAIGTLAAGCNMAGGPAPLAISRPPLPSATPAATRLYADHNGTFFEYKLPLQAGQKPYRSMQEWPGLVTPPQLAVSPYGEVALASPYEIRFFMPPIVSFDKSRAKLTLKLNPAITGMGPNGAILVDLEYDPNNNLWLFNNLGGAGPSGGAGISELRSPISKSSVAAVTIAFGAPGSKTAGFKTLVQGRFDVNAALYVYASASARSLLWKLSFPYARPPSSLGLNLAQADFVDSSQWPPTAPNAPSLLLGRYYGQLHSPSPGSPPSPPVTVMAQFPQPFNPSVGRFPDAHVNTLISALVADPYRAGFYTLDSGFGRLQVWGLPLGSNAKPKITLPCPAGHGNCSNQPEHLFLAP